MELDLSNLNLDILPHIPEGIKILKCNNNNLKFIDYLPSTLEELHCENNRLTYLFKLPKNLKVLKCKGNEIRIIEIHESNSLTENPTIILDYSKFSFRWEEIKSDNKIYSNPYVSRNRVCILRYNDESYFYNPINESTILNLSGLKLKVINKDLKIPEGIETLFCDNNDILEIKDLPNSIRIIRCYNNNMFLEIWCNPDVKIYHNSKRIKIFAD